MEKSEFGNLFLFSIDLEDVRLGVTNGMNYKERVPANTNTYLKWLDNKNSKCTFFVTGHIAKTYPSIINEIVQEGHEIACHTTNHITLDNLTPEEFKKDITENILVLMRAGANKIKGFRAPVLSLTKNTQWAYPILKELNFLYSSSVLPAKNPLFGWEGFGSSPRLINNSIIEIPVTTGKLGPLVIPSAAGVYFRCVPEFIIQRMIKNREAKSFPLIGYFHPYDIDIDQENFMHSGINNSKFYNWLMYYNRKNVFKRLDHIMEKGYRITTYNNFIKAFLN